MVFKEFSVSWRERNMATWRGKAIFSGGRLHVGDKAPFEARDKSLLEALNFAGGTVARHHKLAMLFMQGVEGMEKFLLDSFLARQKLHVIDQKDIHVPIFAAEFDERIVL